MAKLTAKRLREVVQYNPDTGFFKRLISRSNRIAPGGLTGVATAENGYASINIDGTVYKAQRLVWLYVYGEFPDGIVDHINGIPSDNRLVNLRVATKSENLCNRPRPKNNTSGLKGICRENKKWKAQIVKNGVHYYIGIFDTKEEAHAAYIIAAKKIHGEFAYTK